MLRGEPIQATVTHVIGGPRWWHRLFGIKRSYGVLIQLTKDEVDWNAFNEHRSKVAFIDGQVDSALGVEKSGRTEDAIKLYSLVLESIVEMNRNDPATAAHRYRSAPINRLSLLLDKQGRRTEAIAAIEQWQSVPDPVGLGKQEAQAVAKRLARLRRRRS